MSTNGRTEIEGMMAQIEELWRHQDTLFDILTASNDWGQKHGPDWTFADVPYHLAYVNRDLVSQSLKRGPNVSADERLAFKNTEELNAWNAAKFAERTAGQTPQESLAELGASREDIRRLVSGMTDEDLDGPVWWPFQFGGSSWMTARTPLMFCIGHDWSEFMQLRIHMGRDEPVPSPAITSGYLGGMIGMAFPMFLDKSAADGRKFTTVFAFSDAGVGSFTLSVADGAASVAPGTAEDADLVLTQSAATWESVFRGIATFPGAIQTGEIQVSDMDNLATFGRLFPMG